MRSRWRSGRFGLAKSRRSQRDPDRRLPGRGVSRAADEGRDSNARAGPGRRHQHPGRPQRGVPLGRRGERDCRSRCAARFSPTRSFPFPISRVSLSPTARSRKAPSRAEQWYEGFETATPPGVHQRTDLTLDAAGGARTEITDIARSPTPIDVRAEMEYRDPNGETQTVSNSITIWPAKWLVGIRADDWVSSPGHVRFRVAVVGRGRQAGRRRAGAGRNFHPQDVLVPQAPGRRILRLRQHGRDAPRGRSVLRHDRPARTAALRREDRAHRLGAGAGFRARRRRQREHRVHRGIYPRSERTPVVRGP